MNIEVWLHPKPFKSTGYWKAEIPTIWKLDIPKYFPLKEAPKTSEVSP